MEEFRVNGPLEVHKLTAMEQSKIVDSHDEKAGYQRMAQAQEAAKKSGESDSKEVNVDKLVELANRYIDRFTTKLSFTYDPELKIPMIYVTEKDTGRVIRQIPPEQMVDLMKKMEEIAGIIYNRRA